MTQRFNPPPGWQVPPGFSPPTGWQPDPSWPAAPTGWNFWIDDAAHQGVGGSAYEPQGVIPADRLRTQLKNASRQLLIGVAVLVVAVAVYGYNLLNPGEGGSTIWWGLAVVGVIATIRGVLAYRKAKKSMAEAIQPGAGACTAAAWDRMITSAAVWWAATV